MRILILGADGMLGHQLVATLKPGHEVLATLHRGPEAYPDAAGLLVPAHTEFGVDVRRGEAILQVLARHRPQAVVNSVGVVKQRAEARDTVTALEVNALFPHRLALMCRAIGARLVHMSTDCVFSGRRGSYRETDPPDAQDVYAMTKLLGELHEDHCLTLRTSIIGLERFRRQGLIEWFLASRGTIKGFRRAIYSGLTTLEMARLIERLLVRHGELHGVWHVAAEPIDKYTLLSRLAQELGRDDVRIEPDDEFVCDRSLQGEAFAAATGYRAPSWPNMLRELADQVRQRKGMSCS